MQIKLGIVVVPDARVSTRLVSVPDDDPAGFIRRLGEDVAPRARELVG